MTDGCNLNTGTLDKFNPAKESGVRIGLKKTAKRDSKIKG